MASDMAAPRRFRITDLAGSGGASFSLHLPQEDLDRMAADLGLLALRKLRFVGQFRPDGTDGWALTAHLGATVVQPCVVTLAPVTTRIEEDVLRRYKKDVDATPLSAEPDSDGMPIPEDDSLEPLRPVLELDSVIIEALALALPDYPRAEDAGSGEISVTEPGRTPLSDADLKPFAGLSALRDKLSGENDPEG
ncbi:YceD family protein [Pseudooceanicola sp. C21-150M6]|uniref:YceD family protein n=1 Tax=Pseudooceanicola sp. C21-150M6 TaxID=3434355 RepID=UPI003D7F8556